jgi:hypothetical protein
MGGPRGEAGRVAALRNESHSLRFGMTHGATAPRSAPGRRPPIPCRQHHRRKVGERRRPLCRVDKGIGRCDGLPSHRRIARAQRHLHHRARRFRPAGDAGACSARAAPARGSAASEAHTEYCLQTRETTLTLYLLGLDCRKLEKRLKNLAFWVGWDRLIRRMKEPRRCRNSLPCRA